ncbi:extradiol ring-cleavage dioxygenase [Pseudoruegeria sp. HB172150]|uniref:DODA-type extradiol aromatic ring-opening family dioxygenase n=1 Tax=Pseudoruegeria sp. HB172150 TaxID=2721164 RepID=UPI0015543A31|nr:extradiol ring-cleavage dioxygenase [Pseudoruegeria sp. HB172150]
MAEIVMGIGASHSPLLNSPAEDYAKHAEKDVDRPLLDKEGNKSTYAELLTKADPSIKDQITPEVLEERAAACTRDIEYLDEAIHAAKLDALIIIGDDQNEQYSDDNMPAILIYRGETIVNNPLNLPDAPEFWKRARSQFHTKDGPIEYPVAHELAAHMIDTLMDAEFDIAQANRLSDPHGEGHAFGYVHQRLMTKSIVPIVPVALNTYFPPNQPRPARCYKLGQEIAKAVRSWNSDARVGILGSGGLTHFVVDEQLDRMVMDACKNKDAAALSSIDPNLINSGTSEIRNWIVVAGACEHLETEWQDYIPCYRSEAGTGCGMGFAIWN